MDDEVDRILFGFQSQACGSVADLLHRMAFEMKSACSQTQTRQVENPRPGSLFLSTIRVT